MGTAQSRTEGSKPMLLHTALRHVFAPAMALAAMLATAPARADEPVAVVDDGDEVEVISGAVTALSCAIDARDNGKLDVLNSCPMSEATKEIVVFDVAEKQIYRVSAKAVYRYELEKAFGGGSVDLSGVVAKVDKSGVATLDVEDYTVNPKPKAGAFKGCL